MATNNHGQVGRALYIKFTPEKFQHLSGDLYDDGYIISLDEFNSKYGVTDVPIHIDSSTQGEYECVCEFGVEVH